MPVKKGLSKKRRGKRRDKDERDATGGDDHPVEKKMKRVFNPEDDANMIAWVRKHQDEYSATGKIIWDRYAAEHDPGRPWRSLLQRWKSAIVPALQNLEAAADEEGDEAGDNPSDGGDYLELIGQENLVIAQNVMTLTGCSLKDAFRAVIECGGDWERAMVQLSEGIALPSRRHLMMNEAWVLLGGGDEEDWAEVLRRLGKEAILALGEL